MQLALLEAHPEPVQPRAELAAREQAVARAVEGVEYVVGAELPAPERLAHVAHRRRLDEEVELVLEPQDAHDAARRRELVELALRAAAARARVDERAPPVVARVGAQEPQEEPRVRLAEAELVVDEAIRLHRRLQLLARRRLEGRRRVEQRAEGAQPERPAARDQGTRGPPPCASPTQAPASRSESATQYRPASPEHEALRLHELEEASLVDVQAAVGAARCRRRAPRRRRRGRGGQSARRAQRGRLSTDARSSACSSAHAEVG